MTAVLSDCQGQAAALGSSAACASSSHRDLLAKARHLVPDKARTRHLRSFGGRGLSRAWTAKFLSIGARLRDASGALNAVSQRGTAMAYLAPSEFVTKMVDAGESKIFMSTRDTVIRAYMAGAILALAAAFAVTINVQTGVPIVGAALFPVGLCMLYLLGFDLLTGVFVLCPLALIDKRPGVTLGGVLRNWGLVLSAILPAPSRSR